MVDVDNLLVDTTRKERFRVFEVLSSMRRYFVVLLLASGSISTFFAVYFMMGFQAFSSPLAPIFLIATIFIGISNIICGLLLLGSE